MSSSAERLLSASRMKLKYPRKPATSSVRPTALAMVPKLIYRGALPQRDPTTTHTRALGSSGGGLSPW